MYSCSPALYPVTRKIYLKKSDLWFCAFYQFAQWLNFTSIFNDNVIVKRVFRPAY